MSQLTQFMPPPEINDESEIQSQPTMCQVHTGAHASHFSRLKEATIVPLATQERLPRVYYT